MLAGHSYGAFAPSLEMQRLATRRLATRRTLPRAEQRTTFLLAVIELVHPGNLGPLPPSPRLLVDKACLMGLVRDGEVLWG